MQRTFVLGSGFSRAVSAEMPIMAGLSAAVRSELTAMGRPALPAADTPVAHDFEQWLNFLVDAPPWLDEAQQLRNRAAFADVAMAIHTSLRTAQLRAVAGTSGPPEWLAALVRYWNETGSTVITFNYDVLVELAWLAEHPDRSWHELYPVPVAFAASRQMSLLTDQPLQALRLLKLHGSLNWWYSGPAAPPGDTVYDTGIAGPWTADGAGSRWPGLGERMVVDKVPMIIPPAAVKSRYYGNQIIRALWHQAAKALGAAEELVLMGFSLPPSDQIVASLIATELPPNALVVPVDTSTAVADNLRLRLGGSAADRLVTAYCGTPDPIPSWTRTFANLS
jgi:hypothetical protein